MLLWLYRLLFPPALLLASPHYLLRMRRRGGYRENFGQHFGRVPVLPAKRPGVRRIWLQAVSVGEMLAIEPLLQALQARADVEIYLTTTTSTGYQLACERYARLTVGIAYFPVDAWLFSRRAWGRVLPDLVILTEGERWPEHLAQAQARGVPAIAVNARLSDRSFRRMQAVRGAVRPLLGGLTRILAASEHDAARFRDLGFPAAAISVTGNIKLDLAIPELGPEAQADFRRQLGFGVADPVFLAASTWSGEEEAAVAAWKALRAAGVPARLLIVPRHAERRGEIEAVLQAAQSQVQGAEAFKYHFRSRGDAPGEVEIAVADTTGELRKLTSLATVVFVGKSLPPHREGQTPVEAAALGRPVLFGPGMSNFRVIARELSALGAARVVSTPAALAGEVVELLRDGKRREAMATAGRAWHQANRGALARTLAALEEELRRGAG